MTKLSSKSVLIITPYADVQIRLDTEFLVVLITKGSQGIPGYMLIIKLLTQQNILATTLGVFSLLTSPTCCTKPR